MKTFGEQHRESVKDRKSLAIVGFISSVFLCFVFAKMIYSINPEQTGVKAVHAKHVKRS